MHLPEALRRRPRLTLLAALVVVQWAAVLAFSFSVPHNGWLYFQGGDETWYHSSAWAIANLRIPDAAIGWFWPYLLSPIALVAGANVLSALPAIVVLQVV